MLPVAPVQSTPPCFLSVCMSYCACPCASRGMASIYFMFMMSPLPGVERAAAAARHSPQPPLRTALYSLGVSETDTAGYSTYVKLKGNKAENTRKFGSD